MLNFKSVLRYLVRSSVMCIVACSVICVVACSVMCIIAILSERASAQTDELLSLNVEGTSKATSAVEAAREIQAQVIGDTARAQVIDVMGEKRFQKNKAMIENKIIRQSAKYIPYVNQGSPMPQPDGSWKMNVEMKLSPASLRKMILDAGLLNDADGPASILPMVALVDRGRGVSLRWWQGEPKDDAHKYLAQLSRTFHEKAQAEFSRQGFHLIKPQETQSSPLPEPYRADHPSGADLIFVSDFYNAPMIMKGDIRFRDSREAAGVVLCSIKIQVVQATSGRTVAEVSRQIETEPGPMETVLRNKLSMELPEISKDLATQVLEAWQRGTLNTNLIRLTLKGHLTPRQLSEFKTGLVQSVHEVKSLKERSFESNTVSFEVDYSGEPAQLADRLKAMRLNTFDTKVSDSGDKGISMEIKTR